MNIADIIKEKNRVRFINKKYKNIGTVIIDDEDITVYASLKLVSDKTMLHCHGIFSIGENHSYLIKPVTFVFDDITFHNSIIITIRNGANVIFKNCVFEDKVNFSNSANLSLINSYFDCGFIVSKDLCSGNVTIQNDYSIGSFNYVDNGKVSIYSDKLKIVNTNLVVSEFNIITKQLIMENSKITSDKEININSLSIQGDNILIKSNFGVAIENENNDFKGKVDAPIYFYNHHDLSTCVVDEEMIARKNYFKALGRIII